MTIPVEMRLPRLSRLRAFAIAADAGTMSGAAARLHLTQPAISRSVKTLERELGAHLLDRRRSGSFLTRDGRIFIRRTRRFFQQVNAAIAETLGVDAESDLVARLARKTTDVHIRSLIAISHASSFRGAARLLGAAEPTLHRPARDFERLLKTTLYRRTIEGIGLSPAGSELARRLALGVVEINAGIEELASRREAVATTMTVGALALAPKRLLAAVAEDLLQTYPKSRLAIREGAYDELVAAMRSGGVDMIFGSLRSPPPFEDLEEEPLFDDPYCVVCRRGHPLARLSRPTRHDLRRYDWIFPIPTLPRRAILDKLIAEWKLSPRVQIETDSLGAIVSDLAMSDRISLLPREYVLVEDRSDVLAVLNLRIPHRRRVVGITSRLDWLPTAFQSEFLSLLRKHVPRPAGAARAGFGKRAADRRH